jgi:hypothetical protein
VNHPTLFTKLLRTFPPKITKHPNLSLPSLQRLCLPDEHAATVPSPVDGHFDSGDGKQMAQLLHWTNSIDNFADFQETRVRNHLADLYFLLYGTGVPGNFSAY